MNRQKETLKNIKLELPDVPNITDININRLSKEKRWKNFEEIIKPKRWLNPKIYIKIIWICIKNYQDKQKVIEEAEKYPKGKRYNTSW